MPDRATGQDLLGWAETLSGIARTGLGFTESLYEKERYEEILKVAAQIRGAVTSDPDINAVVDEWMQMVGTGVSGYVTPKSAVGAVVSNEKNEILLVQRADSGVWLYPTGWADIGYSPVEVAIKEVYEETGIHCEPLSLQQLQLEVEAPDDTLAQLLAPVVFGGLRAGREAGFCCRRRVFVATPRSPPLPTTASASVSPPFGAVTRGRGI